MPHICSISLGKVKRINQNNQVVAPPIYSAIHKTPVSSLENRHAIDVGKLGVKGDEQSNLQVHGGIEKALYAYAQEHYGFWKKILTEHKHLDSKAELTHGYFGENLTVSGLFEDQVFIGDTWHVGNTILQVTELREPCFKLNIKINYKAAAKTMVQSGFSGWYLRVLKTGSMQAGDEIRVEPGTRQVSIAKQNETLYRLKGQGHLDF
jgi:MOSC domain-containing protein YiiM